MKRLHFARSLWLPMSIFVATSTMATGTLADAEFDVTNNNATDTLSLASAVEVEPENIFKAAMAISSAELEENRGTFSPATTTSLLASNSNNTAINSVSGSNTISEGSFSNTSGVFSVIQNSGNNVIIQNSTVVNLEMIQ